MDSEFALWSNGLLEDFRAGTFVPILSELLQDELRLAPEGVRAIFEELRGLAPELATITPETSSLLAAYEARAVLGPRYRPDMLHIALASVAAVDLLVSWNFRHIVRFEDSVVQHSEPGARV